MNKSYILGICLELLFTFHLQKLRMVFFNLWLSVIIKSENNENGKIGLD